MYYINTFLFYSIIGHFLEGFVYTKVDSGILYGHWTPIYGAGAIIILFIFSIIYKKIKNKFIKPIFLFFSSGFILGIFELISGYIIEFIFGRIFWNYSDELFSIFKYTSLKMMIIWGICSVIFIYIIHPFFNFIIKKIPKVISIPLVFLFIFDLIYTIITLGS